MIISLALIILFGMLLSTFFEKMKLPGLLGMLILGIVMGPYVLNIISQDILNISAGLRKIALIVILIRAGLGVEKETLKKVGVPAVKLSFIPGLFEGFTILALALWLLDFPVSEAGMLGFIIAAVSPAVVVPQMLTLIEQRRGAKKGIPTLILTGASVDDVVAITLFSSFLGFYGGQHVNIAMKIIGVPFSILLGAVIGICVAFVLLFLFKRFHMRDTKKTLLILATAILMTGMESSLENIIPIASLLGIMVMGFVIKERYEILANRLAAKFNKLWVFAEIILFVLVGAQVNIHLAFEAGPLGLLIIALGLSARSAGVLVSVAGTNLNKRERLFCVVAYTPKATVQAAIGAVPLAAGVANGDIILTIAVLAIIVTAPLGAAGIRITGNRWLEVD